MAIHDRAGQLAQQKDLINVPRLMSAYYRVNPDSELPQQRVSFGTSGHRGCALNASFNEDHLLAITQAVVDYRNGTNISGPMVVGIDTHALSEAANISVLEVLGGNGVKAIVHQQNGYTPTPVVSHFVISQNNQRKDKIDGLILTPSHNPPQDGGIKYNPPHGGPAEAEITQWIEARANQYLANQLEGVKRVSLAEANALGLVDDQDLITPYVEDLATVIDMQAIADADISIGVDPLGGSGIHYWSHIAKRYGVDIQVVNDNLDARFAFMPLDKDGKIRMDCSSPYAMAGLLRHQDDFDICVGNDPDYDRHGIVCPGYGLMNPNHFLAVAIEYLMTHRPQWQTGLLVGKTLVSSAMIDRVCEDLGQQLCEVPVGFKWFVDGLANGEFAFGGEESAGAAFLKRDGTTWCTDKDGFILALLAAEILAVTGQTPAQRYQDLVSKHGESFYRRIDNPVALPQKQRFNELVKQGVTQESIGVNDLAGEAITAVLTHAPGNGAAIGGLKVTTANAWFAARPSGTEALFKIYAESFVSEQHLAQVLEEAQDLIKTMLD
ncbi:alpha-D-glucose phosphate-specific phosphoglucomutase [Shewanella sp. Scap07]|uniref:phosphoglucomutase (alpha-D-glucose-1,6-bisphosphate-dependent) n=1 Tax=Shewanella sp. Scap07 TaxID=2589987 RepID=UPI0015BD8167|nr:phosphoglucomutase (alpha-D-glucose-1,6-bisphosphate-dependent) [Shewanella sp. Scap07]QLE85506.1 alpha-D-glucose phosphate-specific phosphoglucomutase [Shewanella sp. Scap07]